jgi:NTE family protein
MTKEVQGAANREQRVLVLQGGGALGAYQGGVFQALSRAHLEPDWVPGISIGGINAALTAGYAPERRLARLREFWELVTSALPSAILTIEGTFRGPLNEASAMHSLVLGVPGFFTPRVPPPRYDSRRDPAAHATGAKCDVRVRASDVRRQAHSGARRLGTAVCGWATARLGPVLSGDAGSAWAAASHPQ